jgi:hypothetical protein
MKKFGKVQKSEFLSTFQYEKLTPSVPGIQIGGNLLELMTVSKNIQISNKYTLKVNIEIDGLVSQLLVF